MARCCVALPARALRHLYAHSVHRFPREVNGEYDRWRGSMVDKRLPTPTASRAWRIIDLAQHRRAMFENYPFHRTAATVSSCAGRPRLTTTMSAGSTAYSRTSDARHHPRCRRTVTSCSTAMTSPLLDLGSNLVRQCCLAHLTLLPISGGEYRASVVVIRRSSFPRFAQQKPFYEDRR